MKRIVVRYKAKPDRVEENEQLVKRVFEELRAASPADVRYFAIRLEDGTFIHIAESAGESNPIPSLAAFRKFQEGIKDRCLVPPQPASAVVVGNYRMLAD